MPLVASALQLWLPTGCVGRGVVRLTGRGAVKDVQPVVRNGATEGVDESHHACGKPLIHTEYPCGKGRVNTIA